MSFLSNTTGERLTLPYRRRSPSLLLKLDLYPFLHTPSPTSPCSSFPPPSPFILYVHSSATNPFFSGSKRDLPPWVLEMCEGKGWPLVVGDYRLAPEVGVREMQEDLLDLWDFVSKAEEDPSSLKSTSTSTSSSGSSGTSSFDYGTRERAGGEALSRLNWSILSAAPASEADTGPHTLGEKFALLQQRRGLDPSRCCILGAGVAGSYLTLRLAAKLNPPPLAVGVVGGGGPELPQRHRSDASIAHERGLSEEHRALLARSGRSELAVTTASDRSLHEVLASLSSTVRRGSERWWRTRLSPAHRRRSKQGRQEAKDRRGLYTALRKTGRLGEALREKETMEEVLDDMEAATRKYPPVLLTSLTVGEDHTSNGAVAFLASLRRRDPAAAIFDDLLGASLARARLVDSQIQGSTISSSTTAVGNKRIEIKGVRPTSRERQGQKERPHQSDNASAQLTSLFDPSRRFLHRDLPLSRNEQDKGQLNLLSASRDDATLQGEFDALEAFFDYWIGKGPNTIRIDTLEAEDASAKKKGRGAEKL